MQVTTKRSIMSIEKHTCSVQTSMEMDNYDPLSMFSENEEILPSISMENVDAAAIDYSMENKEMHMSDPFIGMEFNSDQQAYEFYNAYARVKGFGIRKGHTDWSSKKDRVLSREFLCDKEGVKYLKDKREEGRNISRIGDTRVGCKARMVVGVDQTTGKWKVRKFEANHIGHPLTTPSKVMKHHSHQTLHRSTSCKRLVDALDGKGLGPTTICKVVNVTCRSQENSLTSQQCQSILRKSRHNNIGHECEQIINHFRKMHSKDRNFYFAFQLDHDWTMRSIFWADGRARTAYVQFGDVVSFDCTYKTNSLKLPFAPFTGVNHHRQSTLFGCALLADESEETFTWLFTEWLECMSGVAPLTIITDQDKAMCPAIHKVFPSTRHRFCSWHLRRNAIQNLQSMQRAHGEEVVNEFNQWYWSSTKENFEMRWEQMKDKYKLDQRGWLTILYNQHDHWAPLYLKTTFTAGMTSTQRSESINAYFDGYVNAQTEIHAFLKQYEDAVANRRATELDADFKSTNVIPILSTSHKFEIEARDLYTKKVFDIFQEEMKAHCSMSNKKISKSGSSTEYAVFSMYEEDQSKKQEHIIFQSSEDPDEASICCTCAKFEAEGILCRHALHILVKKQLPSIPKKYIMHRWTKEAKFTGYGVDRTSVTSNEEQISIIKDWALRGKCNKILEETTLSHEVRDEFDEIVEDLLKKIYLRKKAREEKEKAVEGLAGSSNIMPLLTLAVTPEQATHITMRDPSGPVITKGRPVQASRIKSGLEKAQDKATTGKRSCGYCSVRGHYITGCPMKKHDKAAAEGILKRRRTEKIDKTQDN